jgi:catechol 2,3-dioxygenase-like lactoylglutathione lyase family enzyme
MILNLLVLRARDPQALARFYEGLGLSFVRERHGKGPVHMACSTPGATFEIYPQTEDSATTGTRIGFAVDNVDASYANALGARANGLRSPADSAWGRRAVVKDPEGHIVELTERPTVAEIALG